jgi:superfamily II DNA or RNA helicase
MKINDYQKFCLSTAVLDYSEFLAKKLQLLQSVGIDCNDSEISTQAFDFQKYLIKLALKHGRFGIFAGTGCGKSICMLNWANILSVRLDISVLILAPLGVAKQTVREAEKFNIECSYASNQGEINSRITITNYERLENFSASYFDAVVLDESSILKAYTSATKQLIIDSFSKTPYKLSCSATPSPNDYMELGNQSEFLGVMTRPEMLAMYFEHDGGDTQNWILKHHAKNEFWKWVNSWAIMLNHPRDIGFNQDGYDLPPLNYKSHKVNTKIILDSKKLIQGEAKGLAEQRKVRKESMIDRCQKALEIIQNSENKLDPWLIWCETNDESKYLAEIIPNSIQVQGSDKQEFKERIAEEFSKGEVPVLITKPSIFGYGMNWQVCNRCIYIGLSHSHESFYQSVRRLWRFGQTKEVEVHIIQHTLEGAIERNLKRKEAEAIEMLQGMVNASRDVANQSNVLVESQKIKIPEWLKTETNFS